MSQALRFPGPEALAAALASGLLADQPATIWRDGPAILVRVPSAPELDVPRVEPPPGGRAVESLYEALPLLPAEPATDEVLFVDPPEGVVALAGELIRLGCDRLALAARALRCRDAPEWIMARAAPGDPAPLRAYTPAGPSVWVAAGWRLGHAVSIAREGVLVLVDADGTRRTLPDGPWHDAAPLTEILRPAEPAPLEAEAPPRLSLRLRLVPTRRAARPRLWVVDRLDRLDDLVASLDEPTLDALHFAVARRGGERWAILRARRDLDLELGTAYAPLAEAEALHVPLGMTLAPRIWPSRLRAALTPRADEVVWLVPRGTEFSVERLAESAFVPLAAWVDFVLDEAAPALEPWVRQISIDLGALPAVHAAPEPLPAAPPAAAQAPALRPRLSALPRPTRPRRAPDVALAALERRLLELLDGEPESPELGGLWGELAHAHPDPREAALAAACSLWEAADPAAPAADLLERRTDLPEPYRRALATIAGRASPAGDAELDVRTAWLGQLGAPFAELARARDRWLDRLRGGLVLARDVPALLRRAGSAPSADARARADALDELAEFLLAAPRPDNPLEAPWPLTAGYLRLTLAHGFALLGEHERAQALAAAVELPDDPVHDAAQALYRARRDELLRAEEAPPIAAEPPEIAEPLLRYKLDRLRAGSSFLGGVDWIDPVSAFRADPTRRSEPPSDLGRLACVAAWEGRLVEAEALAAKLAAQAVAEPDLRRTAARGRALAGTTRGLARQGLAAPPALVDLLASPPEDLPTLVLLLPLAGVLGERGLVARAEELLDAAATEERLLLAQALAGWAAAAAPPDEARRIALRLAAYAPDVTDVLSTNSHFCLSLLRLAEAATSALARDGSPGARQRARLDDDERRVRRRIHRDFAARAPERTT